MVDSFPEYDDKSPENLNIVLADIDSSVGHLKMIINNENEKMEKYRVYIEMNQIENERRQHNYLPLIFEMLKMLAEKNVLDSICDDLKQEEEKKVKEENEREKKNEKKQILIY